jgi:ethanolamine ammonia-lyase small subunit
MGELSPIVNQDPWQRLRSLTPARIALGRAGGSLPTRELLNFQLAHAQARDSVHEPFDPVALQEQLKQFNLPIVQLNSQAADRKTYLLRPDLGRTLDDPSAHQLQALRSLADYDVSIVLSDGLSSLAAHRQIVPLLTELIPRLRAQPFTLAPIALVRFGRVAIQDQIGEMLGAKASLILLGERPGLGAADSLGAYLVYQPRVGKTDADRNCVSNIRPEGLAPSAAAGLIHYLLTQSITRRISGVALKDDRGPALPG